METLSDKITNIKQETDKRVVEYDEKFIKINDVKEFIRKLKERIAEKPMRGFDYPNTIENVPDMIDGLAGDKLI